MGDVLTRKCRHGVLINEGFPFDDVPQHHTTPDTTAWIDLCRPSKSSTSGRPETTHRPHNPHIPVGDRVLRYPRGGSPCSRSSNSDPRYGGGDRGCPS